MIKNGWWKRSDLGVADVDLVELDRLDGPDWATFEVDCGKGAYMRALARDLALALGTVGHVAALRRTIGTFRRSVLSDSEA